MSTFWRSLKAIVTGDPHGYKLVGTDLVGNKYYEAMIRVEGRTKRKVEMKHNASKFVQTPQFLRENYDPTRIPVQWEQWLRRTRLKPPTMQELQADVDRVRMLKERIKTLEAQDKIERENYIKKLRKENSDFGQFDKENARIAEAQNPTKTPMHDPKSKKHASLGGAEFAPEEWSPVSARAPKSKT